MDWRQAVRFGPVVGPRLPLHETFRPDRRALDVDGRVIDSLFDLAVRLTQVYEEHYFDELGDGQDSKPATFACEDVLSAGACFSRLQHEEDEG